MVTGEFVLPVGIASEHKQKAVVCKLDIKFSGLGCSKHDQYRPELSCYGNITIGIVGSEPRIKIHQIRKKTWVTFIIPKYLWRFQSQVRSVPNKILLAISRHCQTVW